ncbi:TRAP dicarboxylate transporter, DctM subunit [Roseobacter sp. SK209-2-6]|uniref:TRAP transporter large permease subunit n=1 Tax=Roseobacter sp. SK209-2-6 TaxID=388739 RepID=UPI0000F3C695|nr:TRAP transporter large permease subunit [Roseobacter sp. SK209-2-6]EBA18260.1 TRAP dicarboxylate transporter, DctM subunit [Roseobacter sp. SK209-2-6]
MQDSKSVPFGFLGKTDCAIGRIEAWILGWGIILKATNTIANVFGQYVFNPSIYFSEELNEFLIVIVTFMGLGYATRKGIHIRMSAIYDALPVRMRKGLMVLLAVNTAFFVGCMFVDSIVVSLILMPIFAPIIKAAGLDPVLVGVLITLQVAIGAATPPFGCNLFTAIEVFRRPFVEVVLGVPPFLIILLIATGLLVAFPQITLFLPELASR